MQCESEDGIKVHVFQPITRYDSPNIFMHFLKQIFITWLLVAMYGEQYKSSKMQHGKVERVV
jgi:hypothetical protein